MSYNVYRAPEANKIQSFPITLFDGTGSMHKEYPRAIQAYKSVFSDLGKRKLEYQWTKDLCALEPFRQAGEGNVTNTFVNIFNKLLSEKSRVPKNITIVFISDGREEFDLDRLSAFIERMKQKYLIQFISVAVGDEFPNSISNTLRSLIHNHDPNCPPLFQVTRSQIKSFQQIYIDFETIFIEIRRRLLVYSEKKKVNIPIIQTITDKQPHLEIVANSLFLAKKEYKVIIDDHILNPTIEETDIHEIIVTSIQQAFISQAQVKFVNAQQEFATITTISEELLSQINENDHNLNLENMKKVKSQLEVVKNIAVGSLDLKNVKESDYTSLQDYLINNVQKFSQLAKKLKNATSKIVAANKLMKLTKSTKQKELHQNTDQYAYDSEDSLCSNNSHLNTNNVELSIQSENHKNQGQINEIDDQIMDGGLSDNSIDNTSEICISECLSQEQYDFNDIESQQYKEQIHTGQKSTFKKTDKKYDLIEDIEELGDESQLTDKLKKNLFKDNYQITSQDNQIFQKNNNEILSEQQCISEFENNNQVQYQRKEQSKKSILLQNNILENLEINILNDNLKCTSQIIKKNIEIDNLQNVLQEINIVNIQNNSPKKQQQNNNTLFSSSNSKIKRKVDLKSEQKTNQKYLQNNQISNFNILQFQDENLCPNEAQNQYVQQNQQIDNTLNKNILQDKQQKNINNLIVQQVINDQIQKIEIQDANQINDLNQFQNCQEIQFELKQEIKQQNQITEKKQTNNWWIFVVILGIGFSYYMKKKLKKQ